MKISIYTKHVYGVQKLYVAGPARNIVAQLTGKATVDNRDIQALELLGHEIQISDSEKIAAKIAMEVV
jgi:hypothetical protein